MPDDIDGISYLPTLLGKTDEQVRHEYLDWASGEGETSIGVRRGPWKLVRYRKDRSGKPDWRLYDLRNDIGEHKDIASKHPGIVEEILAFLSRDPLPLEVSR